MMVGLSLTQLFSDAFGVKFEKEERQQYVKFREVHKKQFHPLLTKWLQTDDPTRKDYGKQINIFKAYADLPLCTVDKYTSDEVNRLNNAEVIYNAFRKLGMSHKEALRHL